MRLSLISILLSICCGIGITYARVVHNNKVSNATERKIADVNDCKDSPVFFKVKIGQDDKKKDCSWVGKGKSTLINERCDMAEVRKHCKKTCGNSQCCEDSPAKFQVWNKFETCEWVKLKSKIRCNIEGISETCTQTCSKCTPPLSLEQRVNALVLKVDQQQTEINQFESQVGGLATQIDNLENKVEEVEALQTQVEDLESEVEKLEDNVNELENKNTNLASRITFLETISTHCCSSQSPSMSQSSSPSAVPSWLQLGRDIDGVDAYDQSGVVSLSKGGLTVAVGAYGNDATDYDSGHVRVYSYNNTDSEWLQVGQDIDGKYKRDRSGQSVSLSEDGLRVAIGGTDYVRVYSYNDDNLKWIQVGQDIDGEEEGAGKSVSMSEDGLTVAIGGKYDNGNGFDSGNVRVFAYSDTNFKWFQVGQDIDGKDIDDLFGASVSLSEDGLRVAIGAPQNGSDSPYSGHAYVYSYNNDNSKWMQVGEDIDGQDKKFGASVSLSADGLMVAVGSRGGSFYTRSGYVRIYSNKSPDKWKQFGQEIDGEDADDSAGVVSLSKDGLTVAIGASGNDGNANLSSGHVRVYSYNDTDSKWLQVGEDIDGEDAYDHSGAYMSLSADGMTVAIGADGNDANGYYSGHVRVYKLM